MKDAVAIIVSALWLLGSGLFIYAGVLNKWNEKHFGHISRDTKSFPIWAAILEKIVQAVALTFFVHWTKVDILKLLAVPLLLVCAGYLSTYSDYKVAARPVLVLTVLDCFRIGIALIIVGLVLGRSFA